MNIAAFAVVGMLQRDPADTAGWRRSPAWVARDPPWPRP